MSPRRTVDEAERSLEANRAELEVALSNLRASAARATDVKAHADEYVAQAREHVQSGGDEVVAGALAIGFVTGGGVSGTLNMPFMLVRVALGRPASRSRLEAAMRQDRYSKQVGRALAAVASADRQMRSRRARVWRLVRPTPRRLFMLGTASGGAFMAMVDEETPQNLQTETRALLDTVSSELGKRIEAVGK